MEHCKKENGLTSDSATISFLLNKHLTEKEELAVVIRQELEDVYKRQVYAYLSQTRQISADVINEFVKRKMLYQDVRNNCVFVSRNKAVSYTHLIMM